MSLAYWKAYSHLVQTGHVSSRCWTQGWHGREPKFPSTWYSKAPFWSELLSVMNILLVFVNTDVILLGRMIVICSHQVLIILLGPSRWTVILCWDHQHWATWLDKAHSTRRIVIIEIALENGPTVITSSFDNLFPYFRWTHIVTRKIVMRAARF